MTSGEIQTGAPVDLGLQTPEELARVEQEILLSPRILESGLTTLIHRYFRPGTSITSETTINLDNGESEDLTVFAGFDREDIHRRVIYQKDKVTGKVAEWIVFSDYPKTKISDGSGRPLESENDRGYVRRVLDAMKANYSREVTELADEFDIQEYIVETLGREVLAKEAELAILRSQLENAEGRTEPYREFKVVITDAWEREGGKSLNEMISAGSLSEVLGIATKRFKALNNRSDVQPSSFRVSVAVGEGQFRAISNERLAPLFYALCQYDQESSDLEAAKQKRSQES